MHNRKVKVNEKKEEARVQLLLVAVVDLEVEMYNQVVLIPSLEGMEVTVQEAVVVKVVEEMVADLEIKVII